MTEATYGRKSFVGAYGSRGIGVHDQNGEEHGSMHTGRQCAGAAAERSHPDPQTGSRARWERHKSLATSSLFPVTDLQDHSS